MTELEEVAIWIASIDAQSLERGQPRYIIETEFQKWCGLHANFFLQRYKGKDKQHWTKNEIKTTLIGLAGQKAFDMLTQKMEVACVPNDPMLDQRHEKDYDFLIPQLGKIEVKTIDHYCRKVLIKATEWHGNDYLVVWQFENDENQELQMVGWLSKEQVEEYPITPKGEAKYTKYASARVIDLSELNPTERFVAKLREAKEKMFS